MKRRILSFMMAVVMLFGAVPVGALAQDAEDSVIHYIDDVLWLPQGEEPTEAVVETGEWVLTEETDSKTELVCQNDEHVHKTNCPVDEEGNFVCDGHVHTDACREMVYDHAAHAHTDACDALVWSCGLAESAGHEHASACYTLTCEKTPAEGHTHGDSCRNEAGELTCGQEESAGYQHTSGCYTLSCTVEVGAGAHSHEASACTSAKTCTTEEHTHDENCVAVPGDYACGQDAHEHVTGGCAADCALEEHTHGEACYQTVELAKWIVALKDEGMLMAPIWKRYYNHVDVRVNGEYTGNKGSGNIRIENPSIRVETCLDGENWETVASGSMTYDGANSEFRRLGLRLDTTMTRVTLTCDVRFTSGPKAGTTVSGVQVVFASEAALNAANRECPDHSGLDFIVTYEHIEKALYDVTYIWKYMDENGNVQDLPAGFPATLPEDVHNIEENSEYVVDTTVYGPVEFDGYRYEFQGWTKWHDDAQHKDWLSIEGGKVEVVGLVTILGYWTRTKLTGNIEITKDIAGDLNEDTFEGSVEVALVNAEGKTVATQTLSKDAGWSAIFENIPVGAYTITETPDDQPGYSYDAEITGGGNLNLTGDGAVVAIVNKYSKMESTEVHNYPTYTVNKQDENAEPLAGAQFTLYADEACSTVIKTATTGDDGVAEFNFNGIAINFGNANQVTFYLKETKAPIGYKLTTDVVPVTVKKAVGSNEVWDAELGKWVTTYNHELIGEPNSTVVNEALTGSITIKKEFSGDLSAADFEEITLEVSGVETPVVLNADNNWTATVSGLPMGTYHITETPDADKVGYIREFKAESVILADTTGTNTADLTASVTVTNSYTKKESVDNHVFPVYTLTKVDAKDGAALSGAVFTLKGLDEDYTFTTGSDGKLTIDFNDYKNEISFGEADSVTFTLEETKAPAGYILGGKVSITINKGEGEEAFDETVDKWVTTYTHTLAGDRAVKVENTALTGSVTINKVFEGLDNGFTGEKVVVQLQGSKGHIQTAELTAENNWTVTLTGLPLDTYTVTEPAGYADQEGYTYAATFSAETVTFAEEAGRSGTYTDNTAFVAAVTVTNTYSKIVGEAPIVTPAGFIIHKVNADNEPLAGAVFTLYQDEACTTVVDATKYPEGFTATAVSGADGKAVFAGLQLHVLKLESQAEGRTEVFYLKESQAPAGYTADNTIYKVQLDEEITIEVWNAEKKLFENFVDWIVNVFNPDGINALENGILTVVNEKRETTLTVKKEVVYKYNGKVVTGDAAAALKEEIGNPAYEIVVDINGEKVTKSLKDGESAELPIAFDGTYTVTETVADNAKFNVEENEITGTVSVNDLAEGVEVVITNIYEFTNYDEHEDKPGKLLACVDFTKIDGVTKAALAGAEFGLYDAEGQKVAQDADCIETTGTDGALHFHVTEAGEYTLKEIKAPAGYADAKVEIKINVTTEYEATEDGDKNLIVEKLIVEGDGVEIANTRENIDLTVTKAWNDGGYYNRPTYVQVQLMKTTEEGKEKVGDHVTLKADNNWTYTWADLDPYSVWSVEEYAVGRGYTATYSDNEVTIADGTDVTVTITNTRPVTLNDITVTKVWKGGSGKSITVRLYQDGVQYGDAVVITKNDKWTYTWEDMPDTSVYSIKEDRISGYYTKITSDASGLNWTITNTRSVIPQTGDMIMVTVGVMSVSAAALVVLLMMKRRKYDKN